MIPVLQASGYISCSISLLKRAVIKEVSCLLKLLNIPGSKPSIPAVLFLFSACIAALTSSIGWSRISSVSTRGGLLELPLLSVQSSSDIKYILNSSSVMGMSVLLFLFGHTGNFYPEFTWILGFKSH